VAATIFGMLGRCEEAEDIGQETFMRFFKAMNNFKGKSSVGTYLIRIAINLSLNEIKRKKRRNRWFYRSTETKIEIESLPDEHSSINSDIEVEETKAIVRNAIQQLESKFRSVIVLRLIDGYTTQETANILELPIGTVLSRLARAQEKLKKILKPTQKNEEQSQENKKSYSPGSSPQNLSFSTAKQLITSPCQGEVRG